MIVSKRPVGLLISGVEMLVKMSVGHWCACLV